MQKTIFENTWLRPVMRYVARLFFWSTGWEIESTIKIPTKCVIAAVPHRTWQDLPYTMMIAFRLNLSIRMVAKEELFRPPFRTILLWLGCTPVQRKSRSGAVPTNAALLRNVNSPLQLVYPPAGTRDLETNIDIKKWGTGFYFTAKIAEVAIVLFYIDYKKRRVVIREAFMPTENFDEDMELIRQFYYPLLHSGIL